MSACPDCGAELQTPLVCDSCGALQTVEQTPSPFRILGLPRGWLVDKGELNGALLRLTRLTHPDFHGVHGAEARERAEHNTALVNTAYSTLDDEVLRAEWLLSDLGAPSPDQERQMPQSFLMEVLEWNEVLEEVRAAKASDESRARLRSLREELQGHRSTSLGRLGQRLQASDPGDPVTLRQELNSVRYLDRTLTELDQLTLDLSASQAN